MTAKRPADDPHEYEPPALFEAPVAPRQRPVIGRAERALNASVRRARDAGDLELVDDGAIVLARASARAVDLAEREGDTWKLVAAGRELRANLERLKLDPASRNAGAPRSLDEQLAELLRDDEVADDQVDAGT